MLLNLLNLTSRYSKLHFSKYMFDYCWATSVYRNFHIMLLYFILFYSLPYFAYLVNAHLKVKLFTNLFSIEEHFHIPSVTLFCFLSFADIRFHQIIRRHPETNVRTLRGGWRISVYGRSSGRRYNRWSRRIECGRNGTCQDCRTHHKRKDSTQVSTV